MGKGQAMIENFVAKHGVSGLRDILRMFKDRISNQLIAHRFNVTRQRVHQWQKAFTNTIVMPSKDLAKFLDRH